MSDILKTAHLERDLIRRGVNPPLASQFLGELSPDTVEQTIAWFDAQQGRVGAGVLVAELRAGGRKPAAKARSMADEQEAYGEEIVAWLREHFPEWNREDGNRTHTAAVAAVIRLHHKHGKGRLSAREHGPEIRAAVKTFEERYGQVGAVDGSAGEGEG